MAVFLLPEFIRDLQSRTTPHFARHVLRKTLRANGAFRLDSDDHRYEGVDDAWIRYISAGRTAYRVIYLRRGENVYLFRAGGHDVEDRLAAPSQGSVNDALAITEAAEKNPTTAVAIAERIERRAGPSPVNRFRRNLPTAQISREIMARRKLPHKDIWLVAPFINSDLFLPTAAFGKLLLDQVEDGASVVIVTSAPKDKNIQWMERLGEHKVNIFVYPRLHTKLYCFLFDENRRHETGLRDGDRYSSLILVGSANLTRAGMAMEHARYNEELCYMVPENEVGYVETYMAELMSDGYELPDVRRFLARGQWQQLEKGKW